MKGILTEVKGLNHTDNLCTVGWTCVHASWTVEQMNELDYLCPEGSFSITTGQPIRKDIRKGIRKGGLTPAYFNLPMGSGCMKVFAALGLYDELFRLRAGACRHRWPSADELLDLIEEDA